MVVKKLQHWALALLLAGWIRAKLPTYMQEDVTYFIEYNAHFFQKNDDEILPGHYTWKVVEKGPKIKWMLWC
jgi:hypothetical protein